MRQQRVHIDQRGAEDNGAAFESKDVLVVAEDMVHAGSGEFDSREVFEDAIDEIGVVVVPV